MAGVFPLVGLAIFSQACPLSMLISQNWTKGSNNLHFQTINPRGRGDYQVGSRVHDALNLPGPLAEPGTGRHALKAVSPSSMFKRTSQDPTSGVYANIATDSASQEVKALKNSRVDRVEGRDSTGRVRGVMTSCPSHVVHPRIHSTGHAGARTKFAGALYRRPEVTMGRT